MALSLLSVVKENPTRRECGLINEVSGKDQVESGRKISHHYLFASHIFGGAKCADLLPFPKTVHVLLQKFLEKKRIGRRTSYCKP